MLLSCNDKVEVNYLFYKKTNIRRYLEVLLKVPAFNCFVTKQDICRFRNSYFISVDN